MAISLIFSAESPHNKDMLPSFIQEAFTHGEKATLIPMHRLECVRNEIERLTHDEILNGFQQWIVNDLYAFDVPDAEFTVSSIILLAVPHPFYAPVEFNYHGKTYHCLSLVMSDFDSAEQSLQNALQSKNYHLIAAPNIPFKRLAVQSGFAVYGRNNICYIDGMGSNFSFNAYFSDMPCDNGDWAAVKMASRCAHCTLCVKHCPTGAIRQERFLIDNERCLSYLNESGESFPEWLPKTVHHSVYDCLQCQMACPMNAAQIKRVGELVRFTESETEQLLAGTHVDTFSASFRKKAVYLGLHQWPDGIAKNLNAIIELSNLS